MHALRVEPTEINLKTAEIDLKPDDTESDKTESAEIEPVEPADRAS